MTNNTIKGILGFQSIFQYVKSFIANAVSVRFLIPWTTFLSAAIWMRYQSGISLEFWWTDYPHFFRAFFYSAPFLLTCFLYAWSIGQFKKLISIEFAALAGAICFVLWANQYWLMYKSWWSHMPTEVYAWLSKTSYNLHVSFFFLLVPLAFYGFSSSLRKQWSGFYGLSRKGFEYRPYLTVLVICIPFVFWASFEPDFQKLYPRYRPGSAELFWDISPWITVLGYQASYALQFIMLELFYRGFMVMSVGRFLGQGAIWPMVSVYCFLHFTKPMPEAIGAIFGGLFLGIIAYHSKSIWGGVWIHLGIAMLMEIFAYLAIFVW